MNIVVSVFAVAVALSCLIALTVSEVRDYRKRLSAERAHQQDID